ncbi:Vacuolar protein-sorting-associated protein 36 [Naganishia albida]|nr:Vacuolar protein-sorting-associated protein 36 [Naganishia albida]
MSTGPTDHPVSNFLVPLSVPNIKASQNASPTAIAHSVLHEGEEWIYAQDGVGLYQGNTKIPTHQLLSVQLTTHRLLFICSSTPSPALENTIPPPAHLQVHLADIRQTEHYTGFLRSSSKITLQLGVPTNQNDTGDAEDIGNVATSSTHSGGRVASWPRQSDWTCRVCGFHNEAISATAIAGRQSSQSRWSSAPGATACKLCGVARPEDDDPGRTTAVTSVTSDSPTVSTTKQVPCPRCTYLNDPRLYACEICGAKLTTITNQTPDPPPPESIRISFRKGGDKEVYRRLKSVLASRTWEGKSKMGRMGAVRMAEAGTPVEGTSRSGTPTRGIGIDGILANIDLENKAKTEEVKDAFEDLEALMVRAGEMVKLVQSLNAKLATSAPKPTTNGSPDPEAETRTFLRSSLVQLGLPVPAITQDAAMMKDERAYLDALAAELGGLLTGSGSGAEKRKSRPQGLMVGSHGKGILGMDEAWVIWNRARGVSLVSPQVMQKVVPLLTAHTHPSVEKLRFLSGLEVLHTPVYSPTTFERRVTRRLEHALKAPRQQGIQEDDGAATVVVESKISSCCSEPYTTTLDIALTEGLSVSLTKEMLSFIEMIPECGLVRDGQGDGGGTSGSLMGGGPVEERWYRNLISHFNWVDINAARLYR